MTDGGAEAVGTGVATTDDDDVLVLGGDVVHGLYTVHASGRVGQELHREVNALELAAGNLHVTRHGGADSDDHGVIAVAQIVPADVLADLHARAEAGAFASICLTRRSIRPFSSLKFGMP